MDVKNEESSGIIFAGYARTRTGKIVTTWTVRCKKCSRERTVKRRDHAKRHAGMVCKYCSNKNNHPQGELRGVRISFLRKYALQAAARGLAWNVTHDHLVDIADKQSRKCAMTGVPLCFSGDFEDITASLDRINNHVGYEKTNVQWVHKEINMMRGRMTTEQFVLRCRQVAESATQP